MYENVILKTEEFVKKELFKEATGHDWFHTERVRNMAKTIAIAENADLFTVEISALLHDIGDHKLYNGDENKSSEIIKNWLAQFDTPNSLINQIIAIVDNLSYTKSLGKSTSELNSVSIEAKVVCDADRLDAIGAIGIARVFAYGGFSGRVIHDPSILPREITSKEIYLNKNNATSVNHFYEKLLNIKDKMYTEKGKIIAQERHDFMISYLDRFYSEWEGKK